MATTGRRQTLRGGISAPATRSVVASKKTETHQRPAGAHGGRRTLVLLVDDDPDSREMYGQYLRAHDFLTVMATNGREAIAQAELLPPHLVVMDLCMPHCDGWEATRCLKRNALTKHIPIIACTGHVLGSSAERALDAGCDGYVAKPCSPANLLVEIRRVLPHRGT
jgi:two-component system cell cycle response regulator DivK